MTLLQQGWERGLNSSYNITHWSIVNNLREVKKLGFSLPIQIYRTWILVNIWPRSNPLERVGSKLPLKTIKIPHTKTQTVRILSCDPSSCPIPSTPQKQTNSSPQSRTPEVNITVSRMSTMTTGSPPSCGRWKMWIFWSRIARRRRVRTIDKWRIIAILRGGILVNRVRHLWVRGGHHQNFIEFLMRYICQFYFINFH